MPKQAIAYKGSWMCTTGKINACGDVIIGGLY